jgi:predicted RNA-binding protein with PUA domain
MVAVVIVFGLLIGLIVFDLAALRWGIDSSDRRAGSESEAWSRWRGVHGN